MNPLQPTPVEEMQPAPMAWPEAPVLPRTDLQCHATGCTDKPLVHWQRRLTDAEVAAEHAREQGKRDARMLLRDTQKPAPDFGPLPDPASYSYLVHACGQHAIGMEAAALIHAGDCAGPDSPALPDCGCTPEAPSAPAPRVEQELPAHWISAAAGT